MSQELTVTVPEDIILELNNGNLTIKVGSKVYVPNGSGIFDTYIMTGNMQVQKDSSGKYFIFLGSTVESKAVPVEYCYSGNSEPVINHTYAMWYDTLNNRIKYTSNNGTTWSGRYSFPFCVVINDTPGTSNISSIEKVFNGFGYIGNELFVTKDVSADVPMGFNDEGMALFETYTTDRVLVGEKTTDYPYLVGNNGHFTGIYCASSYNNYRAGANLFFENMKLLARPLNSDTIEVNPSLSYTTRLIGQYANSPVMLKLANGLGTLFDDSSFVSNWYDVVFNLSTATGYGLDVWGKILNRDRKFTYKGNEYYLQGAQTIDGVNFSAEEMDNLYRKVLQLTAMRYIGNASIASINRMIQFIFEGKCYCIEYAPMQIRYVFRFYMNKIQKAVIETLNPHPTGVLSSFEYLPVGRYFGFHVNDKAQNEQPYLPFDNGPFYQ